MKAAGATTTSTRRRGVPLATASLLLACCGADAGRQVQPWDQGWLFHRGSCPGGSAAPSIELTCTGGPCLAAGPPPPAPPADPCAAATLDDSSWRALTLPHDWSREDLPARDADTEFPVISPRDGDWKLRAGDNASWAEPGFDDFGWETARGGEDWRVHGPAFEAVNATGWYRQRLPAASIPAFMLRNTSHPLTLSLGIVAGADQTYLNGQLLGDTPAKSVSHPPTFPP
jgi:hypothetical protein